MQKYKSRKDVPDKYKWDLTSFFKTEEDFEKSYKDCQNKIKKINEYKGCTKDPNKLYEFLEFDRYTKPSRRFICLFISN